MRFAVADLLPPVVGEPFDLVVANLPYVRSDVVPFLPVAASFEPRDSLDGGPDGLAVIGQLLTRLPDALAPDGEAFIEIGSDQAEDMRSRVATVLPGWWCRIEADLADHPRVAHVARTPAPAA
jgi:release factor glutamine methyltransferase